MASTTLQPITKTEIYVLDSDFIAELITVNVSHRILRTLYVYNSGDSENKLLLHKSISINEKDEEEIQADIGSFLCVPERCKKIWSHFIGLRDENQT